MAIDPDFALLMTQTVTIQAPTTTDAYGKATYGTATTVQCHVVEKVATIVGADGRPRTSQGSVYCFGPVTVDDTYRLVLPSGRVQPIIGVQTRYDESGAHHTVISYG